MSAHLRGPVCCKCRKPLAGTSGYCPGCRQDYDLWRWYRLTRAEFDAMLAAQRGCCAICSVPFGVQRRVDVPYVDHKHDCAHPGKGKEVRKHERKSCCRDCVRGLLCNECNILVGWLEQRAHLLSAALRYLGTQIEDAPHEALFTL